MKKKQREVVGMTRSFFHSFEVTDAKSGTTHHTIHSFPSPTLPCLRQGGGRRRERRCGDKMALTVHVPGDGAIFRADGVVAGGTRCRPGVGSDVHAHVTVVPRRVSLLQDDHTAHHDSFVANRDAAIHAGD